MQDKRMGLKTATEGNVIFPNDVFGLVITSLSSIPGLFSLQRMPPPLLFQAIVRVRAIVLLFLGLGLGLGLGGKVRVKMLISPSPLGLGLGGKVRVKMLISPSPLGLGLGLWLGLKC